LKLKSILLFILISTSITLLTLSSCEKKENKISKNVKIYGNLPLSGPIALFSGKYPLGFQMGINDTSRDYNIDKNIFEIKFDDNQGKTKIAANIATEHITKNPNIYISGTSQMSEAIMPQISKLDIPHFLVSFDTTLNDKYPNTFTILPNFKLEAPLFLEFISKNRAKKVFFFTPNLKAYKYQFNTYIKPFLEKNKINYEQAFFNFDERNFKPLVLKARNYNPDVIIVSGYAFHVYPIIKQLKGYNMDKNAKIMATLDYIDLIHDESISPKEIGAFVLGEHGDSSISTLEYGTIQGIPFKDMLHQECGLNQKDCEDLHERV